MKLSQILPNIDIAYDILDGGFDGEISDIVIDSRLVKENAIFVALKGIQSDGHDYINKAIEFGAKVIIVDAKYEINKHSGIIFIKTSDNFLFLTKLLQNFYVNLPKNIYSVTGTNGKTSIVEFIRQILNLLGKKSATIGTLGVVSDDEINGELTNSNLTTSDIASLYRNLAILKKSNIDDVAIEVSSIGLEQKRINGINLATGSFSNFTIDHLDYHKTKEEYFRCKMLLFGTYLGQHKVAIINSDIVEFDKIKEIATKNKQRIIEFGKKAKDLKILEITKNADFSLVKLEIFSDIYQFRVRIEGEFQIYNILCALANILAKYQLDHDQIKNLLSQFESLKTAEGRMDLVGSLSNKAKVFIDFAHSPDALENVLLLARNIAKKRVLVLFGCGGNRDKSKRKIMGNIAAKLADFVIISDDNPRNEDPALIRKEIISGINNDKFIEISPREVAIKEAITMLESEDILILAGKGHEKYQIIGDQKKYFDEFNIAKDAILRISQS